MVAQVKVKAYASSGCVLLAFDWEDGPQHPDFLGFAIQRNPGYGRDGKPQFLFNKLDFVPLAEDARPKGSDQAPIQKFNWWDGGINTADQGKTFEYTVIPVLGTGPKDLKLQTPAAGKATVSVPKPLNGKIATYFNRAVVSSQSFKKLKDDLDKQMEWLANGLQDAIPEILDESDAFDCAIYHLSDNKWIIPAFDKFKGRGSITYFDKGDDSKSRKAAHLIADKRQNISIHKRDAITKLMHDKFIVSYMKSRKQAVLMGSTNFTPEAQTIQANLLHILHSPELADLYAERARLLAKNVGKKDLGPSAWHDVKDIPGSKIRVHFLPEPGAHREFLDTVTQAVTKASSSILFCMYTASDKPLMDAIFAQGDFSETSDLRLAEQHRRSGQAHQDGWKAQAPRDREHHLPSLAKESGHPSLFRVRRQCAPWLPAGTTDDRYDALRCLGYENHDQGRQEEKVRRASAHSRPSQVHRHRRRHGRTHDLFGLSQFQQGVRKLER